MAKNLGRDRVSHALAEMTDFTTYCPQSCHPIQRYHCSLHRRAKGQQVSLAISQAVITQRMTTSTGQKYCRVRLPNPNGLGEPTRQSDHGEIGNDASSPVQAAQKAR